MIVQVDTDKDPVFKGKSFDEIKQYLFLESKKIYEENVRLIDIVVAAQENKESGGTASNKCSPKF